MSQQAQGLHALSPGEIPPKRKRGRPRKDSAQAESTPEVPAPSSKKHKQSEGSSHQANGMLGQVVSGVINGTFHAGYLLNVKVGDSETELQGLVFLPGLVAPITPANDVAPYARMYRRRAVPFPTAKRQSQTSGSAQPEKSDKQPVEPNDEVPKVARAFYSQFSDHQSCISEAPEHLAVVVPLADNASKTDTGLSLSREVRPPQMEESKVAEPVEVLQEIEAPNLIKEPTEVKANVDSKTEPEAEPVLDTILSAEASKQTKGPNEVEATEDSKADPESEPVLDTMLSAEASKLMKGPNEVEATEESKVKPEAEQAADVFPGIEISTLVKGPTDVEANKESKEPAPPLAVEISHGVEAVLKESEIHDEVMTENLELNQAAMAIERALENSELVNNSMEKQGNKGVLEELQSGRAVEVPNEEGKPVGDATNCTGVVSFSAVKQSQEEIITPETELASEVHVPAGPTEPEIRSPSGDMISMECDEQDALPPPHI